MKSNKNIELEIVRNYDKGEGVKPSEAPALGACTMMELHQVIRKNGVDKYMPALPAATSTHLEYKAGATTGFAWNEGEKKTKIPLPLNDGWYLVDKKFGIPNGKKSDSSNPEACYFSRFQDRDFGCLLVRRNDRFNDRRNVNANYDDNNRFARAELERKRPYYPLVIIPIESTDDTETIKVACGLEED